MIAIRIALTTQGYLETSSFSIRLPIQFQNIDLKKGTLLRSECFKESVGTLKNEE